MSYVRSGVAVLVTLSLLLGWTPQAAAAEDSAEKKYEELQVRAQMTIKRSKADKAELRKQLRAKIKEMSK